MVGGQLRLFKSGNDPLHFSQGMTFMAGWVSSLVRDAGEPPCKARLVMGKVPRPLCAQDKWGLVPTGPYGWTSHSFESGQLYSPVPQGGREMSGTHSRALLS